MLNLEESRELVKDRMPNFAFPSVELQPLFFGNNIQHPTRKALVGTLNGESHLYAEPSGRYQLVHHEQVIGNVIDFVESSSIKDMYGKPVFIPRMWGNGSKMKFDITFPDSKMMVEAPKGKVEVSPRISFVNSYDLTKKISLLFEALQLVCLNGMIAHRAIEQTRKRHMVSFDMQKMLSLVQPALENYPAQMATWTNLARINMKPTEFEDWVATLTYGKEGLLFGQKSFDEIMHQEIIGSLSSHKTLYGQFTNGQVNMWEAHNSFTQYITHKIKSEDVRIAKGDAVEDHFMKLLN